MYVERDDTAPKMGSVSPTASTIDWGGTADVEPDEGTPQDQRILNGSDGLLQSGYRTGLSLEVV